MKVYIEPRDWWVGYYRGDTHHYVCPLPTVVIRWTRRIRKALPVSDETRPDREALLLRLARAQRDEALTDLAERDRPTRPVVTPEVFLAAHAAVKQTLEDLDVDWTAHRPIQGEGMPKVLAYRVADAVLPLLLPAPHPEELTAENDDLRRRIEDTRAILRLPSGCLAANSVRRRYDRARAALAGIRAQ